MGTTYENGVRPDYATHDRHQDNFSASTLSIPGDDSKPSTASSSASPSNEKIDGEEIAENEDPAMHTQHTRDSHNQEKEKNQDGGNIEPTASVPPSVNNFASIPNGGLKAWLQVLGSFFLFFNSWGIVNTFGSYQTYYSLHMLSGTSSSTISWIGSIQSFLLMFVSAIAGPIYDAGYFRELLFGGSFLLILGQMMLSLCHAYWQVLLAQAFCIGIGCGMLFVPSVAILSTYFTTRLGAAVGLAAAGSSVGGVVYPIAFQRLQPLIGFAWATRVIGFLILATLLFPLTFMRLRTLPASRRALLDLPAFRQPSYTLTIMGFFTGFIGLYMPFFYTQIYALEKGIMGPGSQLPFYLLAIMNSTSTFGRIIPNLLSDTLGPFNVGIPCTAMSAVICFLLIVSNSSASIIVLIAFYGFFSGTFVSLPPTIFVQLSGKERSKIGARMGQGFAIVSVGMLVGTPIGGAIVDRHGFTAVWIFGGVMILVGASCLVAARWCFKGLKVLVKC
jgi:predicted MFS family arabinose efflux permease